MSMFESRRNQPVSNPVQKGALLKCKDTGLELKVSGIEGPTLTAEVENEGSTSGSFLKKGANVTFDQIAGSSNFVLRRPVLGEGTGLSVFIASDGSLTTRIHPRQI